MNEKCGAEREEKAKEISDFPKNHPLVNKSSIYTMSTSQLSIVLAAAVERGVRTASVDFAQAVIEHLSEKGCLNCSFDDAIRLFDFDNIAVASKRSVAMKKVRASQKAESKNDATASIRSKPEIQLPFCGTVEDTWCKAVRFNHGLHTQCTNGPIGSSEYCKTCGKSAANSASGKPTYGDIRDRLTGPLLSYRDPKGKLTTCYANVAAKQGLDIKRAQEVATTFGWTIPADQLEVVKTKRGRPAVEKTNVKVAAKKRGRPTKKNVVVATMDDQIAKLVAEAADEVLSTASNESKSSSVVVKVSKKKKPKKVSPSKAEKKLAAEEKKLAAEKLKAEKKLAAEEKKLAAEKLKAEKKLAAEKLKAEKKLAAEKLKAEKKLAAEKLKVEKKLAAEKEKADKKAAKEVADLETATKEYISLGGEINDAITMTLKEVKKATGILKRKATAAVKKAAKETAKQAALAEKKEQLAASNIAGEMKVASVLTESAIADLQASFELEEEEEEELVLDDSTPRVTIEGAEYFLTKAYGLENVLFSQEGEPIGVYTKETGEIQTLTFEEDDD